LRCRLYLPNTQADFERDAAGEITAICLKEDDYEVVLTSPPQADANYLLGWKVSLTYAIKRAKTLKVRLVMKIERNMGTYFEYSVV